MTNLTQTPASVNPLNFTPHGYPVNPATGKMYSRNEIVTDPTIPYPKHVDPANPGPYWQRRSPADLETTQRNITAKNKRNAAARERNAGRSHKATMDNRIGFATLELVERVNKQNDAAIERFVNETAPQTAAAAELDGPRTWGESIMDLLGQDYHAARERATRKIAPPTNEEAQRMLQAALRPDSLQRKADRRAQFGRGR
jgi:hypothetical protein